MHLSYGLRGKKEVHLNPYSVGEMIRGFWFDPQHHLHQMWCCPLVSTALQRSRQRGQEFKVSLSYLVN